MYYQKQGEVPAKPFTVLCTPDGEPAHEELVTSQGFAGPASLLYRLRPSTAISEVEDLADEPLVPTNGPPRNHQVQVAELSRAGSFTSSRLPLFFNEDLIYSIARPTELDGTFHRNAFADEMVLVVSGSGRIASPFGSLLYQPLDFVYVPRGVTVRLEEMTGPQLFVVLETSSPIGPPPQYIGRRGQLTFRGLYQERDIVSPQFDGPQDGDGPFIIDVKANSRIVRHTVPHHPFDVIGWDGALYPYTLSMTSLAPMSGRIHTTPDLYQVFESEGVYVTAITPIRQPDHENSTSAQPDHSSDCDEIFHRLGRASHFGFGDGAVTLHNRLSAHGASAVLKARPRREQTTGWGLLIDTVRSTRMATTATPGDTPGYHGGQAQ